jgi:hypothetical protein
LTPAAKPAAERIEEAIRLAAEGRGEEAVTRLRALVDELASAPAQREEGRRAFELLLRLLFLAGRQSRMTRLFRQYIATFSEVADGAFDEIYLAALLATQTSPVPLRRRDRFLRLVRALDETRGVEGLVAECGCLRGLSSSLLCGALRRENAAFDGRGYEIYDSFQGLSEPQPQDLGEAGTALPADVKAGRYSAPLEEVRRTLAPFPGIRFFPGWIPAAFEPAAGKRYRFVHVDVDLYQPTRDSFAYFWPRLMPGGAMACDDYGWPGARLAVDEFCRANALGAEITPSNQAIVRRSRG